MAKKDEVTAARWYRKAADQGHIEAQYSLGRMYEQGRGVRRDEVTPARWYKKAADQGMVDAKKSLARWERTG